MGAYYNAIIGTKKDPKYFTRYSTYASDNGAKLMEHSYVGNTYVEDILHKLKGNPKYLGWLCDYHEEDKYTWDNIKVKEEKKYVHYKRLDYYIVNHTKKEFIDMKLLQKLALNNRNLFGDDWIIHPIPILTNSDKEPMGGGDYTREIYIRGRWFLDLIEKRYRLTKEIRQIYTDVTFAVLVPKEYASEEEEKIISKYDLLVTKFFEHYEKEELEQFLKLNSIVERV